MELVITIQPDRFGPVYEIYKNPNGSFLVYENGTHIATHSDGKLHQEKRIPKKLRMRLEEAINKS